MRLYEHEGKALASAEGIPVPRSRLVASPSDAEEAARELGGDVVLKAQVLAGGRGKAGGVLAAATAGEAGEMARRLLGGIIRGLPVRAVLVEERAEIAHELYVGVAIDEAEKRTVVAAGPGGVDVEDAAALGAQFARRTVDPFVGLPPFRARELASGLSRGRAMAHVAGVIGKLYALYRRYDATMAEINPLAVTPGGEVLALDVRCELDDDALSRQEGRLRAFAIPVRLDDGREPTELERRAAEIDRSDHRGVAGRVVEFGGDIALLIGGGGASLTVFDAILRHGGRPANYCEVGGNPTVRKVQALTRLLVSKPGVRSLAVIMNVVSNTRVDLVARGLIKGLLDAGVDPRVPSGCFPIVVRLAGSWEDDGYGILDQCGVRWLDRTHTMDEAARAIVELTRSRE